MLRYGFDLNIVPYFCRETSSYLWSETLPCAEFLPYTQIKETLGFLTIFLLSNTLIKAIVNSKTIKIFSTIEREQSDAYLFV